MTKYELLEWTKSFINIVRARERARGWEVLTLKEEYTKKLKEFEEQVEPSVRLKEEKEKDEKDEKDEEDTILVKEEKYKKGGAEGAGESL